MSGNDTSDPDDQMTCQELVELVTEYLEGTLTDSERRRFEEHLRTCSGCSAYLDRMRITIRLVGRLDEDALSGDARDLLLRTFRDWKRSGRTGTSA